MILQRIKQNESIEQEEAEEEHKPTTAAAPTTVLDNGPSQIAEYLEDQLVFFDHNFAPNIDHFALILSSISKKPRNTKMGKWKGGRQAIRYEYIARCLSKT
jgi:hypothetical protein